MQRERVLVTKKVSRKEVKKKERVKVKVKDSNRK